MPVLAAFAPPLTELNLRFGPAKYSSPMIGKRHPAALARARAAPWRPGAEPPDRRHVPRALAAPHAAPADLLPPPGNGPEPGPRCVGHRVRRLRPSPRGRWRGRTGSTGRRRWRPAPAVRPACPARSLFIIGGTTVAAKPIAGSSPLSSPLSSLTTICSMSRSRRMTCTFGAASELMDRLGVADKVQLETSTVGACVFSSRPGGPDRRDQGPGPAAGFARFQLPDRGGHPGRWRCLRAVAKAHDSYFNAAPPRARYCAERRANCPPSVLIEV